MKNFRTANRLIALFVTILLLATPLLAQQRRGVPKRPAAAPEPAPTFDSLLAADSYKVYGEVRGIGGLIHSPAVNDLLDPIMKLGGPPKEFKTFVKWLGAHADALAGSRMLIAGWPSRPKLPTVIIAIEFSSPEEAKKFYPELRDFLPKLLPTPTPTPTPEPAPKASGSPSETQVRTELVAVPVPQNIVPKAEKEPEPLPPYQMKQAGSLVFISDIAFTFRNLRPHGSKGLEEDQNFLLARNRFSSESVFLYVDLKSIAKEEKEQRQKYEEEAEKRAEAEAANPPKEAATVDEVSVDAPTPMDPVPPPSDLPAEQPAVLEATVDPPDSSPATPPSDTTSSDHVDMTPAFNSLYSALFGGQSKWPEAVGAAVVFEGDAYVVRTLILNGAENKTSAIPFVPQFVSGPAITPEAPGIFPADVDLFVSVSLDYPQIYEGMLKAFADSQEMARKTSARYGTPPLVDIQSETPFALYEKKLGLKVKDDLLPLLGSELALALPRKAKKAANEQGSDARDRKESSGDAAQNNATAGPNPIVAIGVKDREAVSRLIPKLIESFGLKGANLLAQTERRDGTELVSYAGVFSYAFVGDFLVVSPDAAEVRHVVDAYLNHQTLSSDSHFRNYTRWQSHQVQGQVYVAPGLIEEYTLGSGSSGVAFRDKMNEFLTGVNPVIDPVTYSLSNDGLGPLHELHMPKNLLQVLVAGMMVGSSAALPSTNEAVAQSMVRTVAGAQETFKATEGNGGYGSFDQLVSAGLISKEMLEKYGYRIEVSASKDKFEVTAVPIEYGTTGKLSYFIDESQVLRAGDHGGGTATLSDQPVE